MQVEVMPSPPLLDPASEESAASDASPYSMPAWLRTQERLHGDGDRHRYVIARVSHGFAYLPVYVVEGPGTPDLDPRTYVGWQPDSCAPACCGSSRDLGVNETLSAVEPGQLFPALLVGSPRGYQSEVVHSSGLRGIAGALLEAARSWARQAGMRTVFAPWVPDRPGGIDLADTFRQLGAIEAFWAIEDYLPLQHATLEDHVASLRSRHRYRYRKDLEAAAALGLTVRPLDALELEQRLTRIATLVASNMRRHGLAASDAEVREIVAALLSADVPVVATGAHLGDDLIGCCLCLQTSHRLYAKFGGFDYDLIGARSGAYFATAFHGTVARAYERGCTSVEFGVGAHEAKALRGCRPRELRSFLLPTSRDLHRPLGAAAAISSRERRAEFDLRPAPAGR